MRCAQEAQCWHLLLKVLKSLLWSGAAVTRWNLCIYVDVCVCEEKTVKKACAHTHTHAHVRAHTHTHTHTHTHIHTETDTHTYMHTHAHTHTHTHKQAHTHTYTCTHTHTDRQTHILENVEHCGGEPEQAVYYGYT